MQKNTTKLITAKTLAFSAVFAAAYAVLRLIPTFPMIGVPGATFSFSDAFAPLYGVMLGPYVGSLSIVLGTFLAIGLGKPVAFMFLDFLPATMNALLVGLLLKRKWKTATIFYTILLLIFLLNPLSLPLVMISLGNAKVIFPFNWMHIVAFLILLTPIWKKAVSWVEGSAMTHIPGALTVLAFIGTMAQHLTGGILFMVVLGQWLGVIAAETYKSIWTAVFYLYPVERLTLILFATVTGTPLLRALRSAKPFETRK